MKHRTEFGALPETVEGMGPKIACHACSGSFQLIRHSDGAPGAVHTMPYCEAFSRLDGLDDILEFSKQCRQKAGGVTLT